MSRVDTAKQPTNARWRAATIQDDAIIVQMCAALNTEDPGQRPVPTTNTERTLRTLREQPWRGKAVVLEDANVVIGYALLISFWSNELGGEVCTVDELYVAPAARNCGHGGSLFTLLSSGELSISNTPLVALTLETTPSNAPARRLYERHGFSGSNTLFRKYLDR